MLIWMRRAGARLGAIALLALFMRAILPAGYMLAEADTGGGRYVTVQVCDAHASAPTLLNLDTGQQVLLADLPKKVNDDPTKSPCVFAAPSVMIEPQAIAEPVEFLAQASVVFAAVADLRPGRGIAAPPPPSTGPPSLI